MCLITFLPSCGKSRLLGPQVDKGMYRCACKDARFQKRLLCQPVLSCLSIGEVNHQQTAQHGAAVICYQRPCKGNVFLHFIESASTNLNPLMLVEVPCKSPTGLAQTVLVQVQRCRLNSQVGFVDRANLLTQLGGPRLVHQCEGIQHGVTGFSSGSTRSRTPLGSFHPSAVPSRTPATGERQTPHRSRGSRCGRERHE